MKNNNIWTLIIGCSCAFVSCHDGDMVDPVDQYDVRKFQIRNEGHSPLVIKTYNRWFTTDTIVDSNSFVEFNESNFADGIDSMQIGYGEDLLAFKVFPYHDERIFYKPQWFTNNAEVEFLSSNTALFKITIDETSIEEIKKELAAE
ncbi:MAG: hypothetical protein KBT22_06650 [Bacteroidales bacterium]|nr:hypothetical protein [Candidatus Scybalocola fimicaballi]